MEQKLLQQILRQLEPRESLSVYEWGKRNIFLPFDYQSPIRGQWSLDLFPYYREPLSKLDCPSVREIVNVKCSQGGGSQNLLLPAALKTLHDGQPVIFVSGQQEATEQFRLERFLPLVKASPAFAHVGLSDRATETYLSNGGLISFVHSSSRQGVKTRPAKLVLADEVDLYSKSVLERLRSRLTQYHNAKLIIISAPDDEAEKTKVGDKFLSPIFLEWADSSQAYYYLQGKTGKPFALSFGFAKEKVIPAYGVKWSQDAYNEKEKSWNIARVAETVHYVDEAGNDYSDKELKSLLPSGVWIHGKPELADIKPGYHISSLYLHNKTLADVATGFLRAKRQGGVVYRTWMLEQFAEQVEQPKIDIASKTLSKLQGSHKRGEPFYSAEPYKTELAGKPTVSIMGVDVQHARNGLWYLIIDICGDYVAVRDWGHAISFSEINDISLKLRANHVACDIRYRDRQSETYEACGKYQMIPCMQHANLRLPVEVQSVDPMSGKRGQGKGSIGQLIFNPSLKVSFFEMLRGEHHTKLLLPSSVDNDLEEQLTAEKYEDGQFIEVKEDANHLLDCLTYSLLIARYKRYLLP